MPEVAEKKYVVEARVREMAQAKGMRVGSDFVENLSVEVETLIERAIARAKDNGRLTLKAQDA